MISNKLYNIDEVYLPSPLNPPPFLMCCFAEDPKSVEVSYLPIYLLDTYLSIYLGPRYDVTPLFLT